MKNLKIYERLKREKNKSIYEKKRFKMKLVALFTIPVLLVGCFKEVNKPINDNDIIIPSTQVSTLDVALKVREQEKEFTNTEKTNLTKKIQFTDEETYNLKKYINEVDPNYIYKDIYNVENAYRKYLELDQYNESFSSNIIKNMRVDNESLYRVVLENNENYFNGKHNATHKKLKDKIVKNICDIIADTINKEFLERNFETNIDDIEENLMNLKIVDGAIISNAYLTDDDILAVSLSQIDNMKLYTGSKKSFEIIISHETEHILQKLSVKTIEKENILLGHGFCLKLDNLDVNSLYYLWLIESSAENLSVRLYDSEPLTYVNKIGYLNSLTMSQILDDSFNIYDIEKLTQQSDLNELFKLFKADTLEKKYELLNLMYTLEVIQEGPDEFINIYENKYLNNRKITDQEFSDLKYSLKGSVCTNITKYFYINLINKMEKDGLKLSEIYDLLSIFEEDINNHLLYNDENKIKYNKEFIKKYDGVQRSFFELLSEKTGIDVEEINYMYETYNLNVKYSVGNNLEKIVDDVDIENLSENKNVYLTKIRKRYIDDKTITIHETKEKYCDKIK